VDDSGQEQDGGEENAVHFFLTNRKSPPSWPHLRISP
jgi:hypothetical protein